MNAIRIIANAQHPDGLVLDADTGDRVDAVFAADLSMSAGNVPVAHLHLRVAQVDVVTDRVQWYGLDRVPVEALRAELDRRGAAPPEVTG